MPRPIKVSEKKPFTISSSKKGMKVGKWMANYLLPKKIPFAKEVEREKKKTQQLAMVWKRVRADGLEETKRGRQICEAFYKQAALFTETYWKFCQYQLRNKKNKNHALIKTIRNAERDFSYFWNRENRLKRKKKGKLNTTEIKIEQAAKTLKETRKSFIEAENEYGPMSWQARNALADHLQSMMAYLKAESLNIHRLTENYPSERKTLLEQINNIEEEFKRLTKRAQDLRDLI